MNRVAELGADERVLQPNVAGFTPVAAAPDAAPGGMAQVHGTYSERLPLASGTNAALRRLYSQQEEAESALSSAFQSRVQSASPSQHNLGAAAATGANLPSSAFTAIPMSTPAVSGRGVNGTLPDRPNTNPFK